MKWGQLVESDRIYSTKAKRWFEVVECVRNTTKNTVRLRLKNMDTGNIVRQEKPADEDCGQVERGETGKVVDIFIEIMSSGETGVR